MVQYIIEEPISIVTDRELALIQCLDTSFPRSIHLLCRWHININVLAKTKKFFPSPIKDENSKVTRHPKFKAFLDSWNTLLGSLDEQSYESKLLEMKFTFPPLAISYIEGT